MTREQWLASAEALLDLDAKGALVPHGIGGHARTLLEEAIRHLSATVPAGDGVYLGGETAALIERLKASAAHCDMLHAPYAAAACRKAASRLSQGTGVMDAQVLRLTEENEALTQNAESLLEIIDMRKARIKALEEALREIASGEENGDYEGVVSFARSVLKENAL